MHNTENLNILTQDAINMHVLHIEPIYYTHNTENLNILTHDDINMHALHIEH